MLIFQLTFSNIENPWFGGEINLAGPTRREVSGRFIPQLDPISKGWGTLIPYR